MSKVATKLFVVVLSFAIPFQIAFAFLYANPDNYPEAKKSTSSSAKWSFGGKVLNTKMSGVKCDKQGTLVILGSNARGAQGIIKAQQTDNKGEQVVGTTTSLYKLIPFFATDLNKVPKVGGSILGKAEVAPDFTICYFTGSIKIPIPVRVTNEYAVSGKDGRLANLKQ